MDWYMNTKTGEMYYNKYLTDETTNYNDEEFHRIGFNNLFGDMGDIEEKFYEWGPANKLANKNNYRILPSQQLVA